MSPKPLSRRFVLRGAGGIALALPLLEAMIPRRAHAAGPVTRFVTMYFPDGTYQGTQITGRRMGIWQPPNAGSLVGQAVPPAIAPLANNLGDINVLGGIMNTGGNDGYGVNGAGGHNRACSSFMTCSPQASFNSVDIPDSVDQLVATELAKTATFRRDSLVLAGTSMTAATDNGDVRYMNHISYRNRVNVAQERNPRRLFDSLFAGIGGTFTPPPRDPAMRQSVLDFVKDDTGRLMQKLGTSDQARVDQYMTQLRELERRVHQAEQAPTNACTVPAGPDAALNGQYANALTNDYTRNINAMVDIIVTAFKCDLTRVATLVLCTESHSTSYQNVVTNPYQNANMADGRHIGAAHHEENLEKIRRLISIHQYEVTFFKRLIDGLKATPDTNGTMLDNTIALFGCGLADGNGHNFADIPVIQAGRGGGIVTGRYVNASAPLANLHLEIINRMGLPATTFGNGGGRSTGRVNLG